MITSSNTNVPSFPQENHRKYMKIHVLCLGFEHVQRESFGVIGLILEVNLKYNGNGLSKPM